jgi:hypothetical protein
MNRIKRFFIKHFYSLDSYEKKLSKYSGYKKETIIDWKEQSNLSWKTTIKILNELKIYNEIEIRDAYRQLVEIHKELFYADNTFIIPFGKTGKSGDKLLYEFRRAIPDLENKIIEKYEIVNKNNSNLIFLDDIIGTGYQAATYITGSIQQLQTSTNINYLLTICSTPQGIYEVQQTGFRVITHNLLEESLNYYLGEICNIFNMEEKQLINKLNYQLISPNHRYHLGLLLSFHYSTPDNTMPIIWKNQDEPNGRKWTALLPRDF